MGFVLTNFHRLRPPVEISQDKILAWLAEGHSRAERFLKGEGDPSVSPSSLWEKVFHYGCPPEKISKRGSVLSDFSHHRWKEMEVYDLRSSSQGKGMAARNRFFSEAVGPLFEKFYADVETPPDDLIHVTCTGYVSPSAAQNLVDLKGWNDRTVVTHAYHMGCYAAVPAIRIAVGLLSHPPEFSPLKERKKRADVVHTELCSLHLNPGDHSSEQLVVQSLFADGFIKYSVVPEQASPMSGLKILSLREETVPRTASEMTWVLKDWGMEMTLSRDVPVHLAKNVEGFLAKLFSQAGLDMKKEKEKTHFAVHPGGPLIVDLIQDVLELKDYQVAFSREILYLYGNMSSATLPHIWQSVLEHREVPSGTLVAGLAFGPGLTVCGGLFQKI